MDTSIDVMIREDRREWEALTRILDAHPAQALHAEGPAWTSRDVYAHFARWMERSLDDLQSRLDGQALPPLPGEDDEINARWQQEDSGLTFEQAREWAWRVFDRRVQAIEAVAPDGWNPGLLTVAAADGASHYRAHREWIAVG